jgi:hypothetical protein
VTDEVAAVVLEGPGGERGTLVGPADKLAEIVRPEAVVAPFCTGCSWPGRCKAYGSEGCRMKADEHLHVPSTRL